MPAWNSYVTGICPHDVMKRVLLLAAVLWLWGAAPQSVAAAPPTRPGAAAARNATATSAWQPTTKTTTLVQLVAEPITAQECPGIEPGGAVCGQACQLRLCKALATFYRLASNTSDPWDNEKGWETTTTIPCERLVAASPRRAVYCSWFGISCCTPERMSEGHCSTLNTVIALDLPINNVNVSVENPELLPCLKTLHGCGMRVLNLEANNIIGTFSDDWGDLNKLVVFNFGNCWMSGTLPDGLRRLQNVTLINLSNNWLNGTLPAWLSGLMELRVLNLGSNQGGNEGNGMEQLGLGLLGSIPAGIGQLTKLRELNLEANSLSGELPAGLCNGENSSLLLLNVRGNQLQGDARAVQACGNLVQLDISQNHFAGSLPVSSEWDELATYRAASNKFSGRFPMNLTSARILEHLDISDNALTGMIPPHITLLSSLKTFVVSSNRFSGTVNENIYYLPALAKLDLSNNALVGTLPKAIGLAYGLAEMDISNNPGLTGELLPQMGLLSRLKQVRTTNTNMSCAGVIRPYVITTNNSCSDPDRCITPVTIGNPETRYHACDPGQLLPCFLRFSDYMVPRDDDTNMRCKYIVRRPVEEARKLCSGDDETMLGDQAGQLPELGTDRLQQLWHVDPSYFQYQACECLLGYKAQWVSNNTMLNCVPVGHQVPTHIIVGVVAAAAVLIIALLAWWQYLTTRPRWLRDRILQAKRSRGAPKASKPGDKVTVSIAVTDVKDFSDLTRQYPELMNKAMGIHNNILRKASHNHAGYIMDQEGDSWTVAFHDAEDAVAFSLQVQQALAQRSWGKLRVASHQELSDLNAMRDGVFSTRFSHTHQSSMTSAPRHSSSSFGMMGEDSYSMHGGRAVVPGLAGGDSFTAGQLVDGMHNRINTSFTSSAGRGSSGDRSFTLARRAPSDSGTPHHSGPLPVGSLGPLGPLANGPSKAGAGMSPNGMPAAAAAAAPTVAHDSKQGGGISHQQQHQPDQRQVSFSDAMPGRDASPFYRSAHQQQQQALMRLRCCNSEDEMVQPSGASGNSWPDDAQTFTPASAMKGSFDSCNQPAYVDGRMSSLSTITGVSRARSSGSGSRIWNAGAAVVRRFSVFGRSGLLSGGAQVAREVSHQPALHLSVRIGIATGSLAHGTDLNSCNVKERAKNCVSDVANGGQILLDENTFRAIKDSLSVLGTVNEAGYDDRQLQQLLHNRFVHRLQHHISCGTCGCSGCRVGPRDASFTSQQLTRDIQDYDNDALVVHMGAFEPPPEADHRRQHSRKRAPQEVSGTTSDSSLPSTASGTGDDAEAPPGPAASKDVAAAGDGVVKPAAAAAATAGKADGKAGTGNGTVAVRGAVGARRPKVLHLYAVAAPGMRRVPGSTRDITQCLSWGAPVELKRRWTKVQKGYFDAPGARSIDLAPSAQGGDQAALPEVVIVFAQVVGGSSFNYKRNRGDTHALKKAITRCMLQMLDELPETDEGRDGYLCRCQEADLKYMVSFKAPHMALQWCMLVQEALMYFNWPDSILAHQGFEEVLDPMTGLPLFRGPRLRMGFAAGQPNSVLPDHTGRANYYGHSVNRAARFMEASAHAGQIVTDMDTARQLFRQWHAECALQDGAESAPSRAHSDAEVQPIIAADARQDLPSDLALMQMLASRSLSETTGHCRPSAARLPLSRLALRQQHQSSWLQQLQQSQLQSRDSRQLQLVPQQLPPPQLQQLGLSLNSSVNREGGSASSPLPEVPIEHVLQHLPQLPSTPSGAFTRQQQQPLQLLRPLALPAESGGSFTRRQLQPGGMGSFTRPQVAASGNSFNRRQQQQLAAGPLSPWQQQQGTSMSASFSARRNAVAGSGAAAAAAAAVAARQPSGVVQSSHSFIMQVPPNWQSLGHWEVAEQVCASYLGTFSFKGSGVYDMVQILPYSLVGRQFPEETPKGKGYRVIPAEGPVAGLEPVAFSIPPRLLAAREAFRAARKGNTATGGHE